MYTLLHGSNKYECSKSYPKIDDLRITKFIMHLAICIGGGTNLALRYNHRISIDIDFITPILIGRIGFYQIIKVVESVNGKKQVNTILLNPELDEQFLFLKMFISKEDQVIKVEFL